MMFAPPTVSSAGQSRIVESFNQEGETDVSQMHCRRVVDDERGFQTK
jgi:hypothetical protein